MPLPDFIIIGAMKAGTSTLHSNLQLHPEIGMSKLKEPHYFDRHFSKPLDWYKSQFISKKRINGESTPAYTWGHFHPEVAERMYKTLPNVKLIYVLRDPIGRIISHLHHDLYRGRFKLEDVNKVVLTDPQYIQTSKYFFQVNHYLAYFDKTQILFITTDSLKNDLNNSLNKICDFLGVENYDFSDKIKVRNQSEKKYLINGYDTVHKYLPRRVANLYHLLFYFINQKIDRPVLMAKTLKKIEQELSPDIEQLKNLTGENYSEWNSFNKIKELKIQE